ncbi:hypothetical protein CDAR_71941 [Caerostris darwini]|uniref:Uncharacterized protein n=1 Tax=Caerostris darwini TaxID=1538125 RepID=A0AAV4U8S9_9ARAC|nr:hypothetical protein CDAR_71941 [Caerostris darwini]
MVIILFAEEDIVKNSMLEFTNLQQHRMQVLGFESSFQPYRSHAQFAQSLSICQPIFIIRLLPPIPKYINMNSSCPTTIHNAATLPPSPLIPHVPTGAFDRLPALNQA